MSRDALADVEQGRTLPYNNCPVDFTTHALEKSNERHTRRLDSDRAEHELYALLEGEAIITREPPGWLWKRGHREAGRVAAWLVLEREQLAWPLYPGRGPKTNTLVAGTCLSPQRDPVGAEVRVVQAGTQRSRA